MVFNNINALQSRLKLLFSSLLDFIIINIIFFIYLPNNGFLRIGIRPLFYTLFWIIISYIFNRYYHNKIDNKNSYFQYQFINSIKSIISFGFVFLVYNWILGNYTGRSFLLVLLINLFILSSIGQYLLNKILFRKFIKEKYWAFWNDDKSNYNFKDLNLITKNKMKIMYFDNIFESYNLINNSYGVVINDLHNLTFDESIYLLELKKKGLRIYMLSNWYKTFLKRYRLDLLSEKDFLNVEFLLLKNSLSMRIKRLGDIFISISLLIFSLPIVFLVGILIYLEDRGPIFYSQKRTGYLSGDFTIWKLRSMKVDAEEEGIRWSSKNDSRVTRVGALIRKTRIDELPQLWSVFIGNMSLIGPRPERPEIDSLLIKKIPFYSMRYLLRPGLSGWAQVNYPYGASIQDSSHKLSFDLYYIANYSFLLDVSIFFKTLRLIFNAKGSIPNN